MCTVAPIHCITACDAPALCAQANFLWAYATLGERMGSASLEALAAQAQTQLPSFTAQNLANMMWASAKLEYSPDDTLLRGCEAHATRNAGAFDPQALVRCCLFTDKQQPCDWRCRWNCTSQLLSLR